MDGKFRPSGENFRLKRKIPNFVRDVLIYFSRLEQVFLSRSKVYKYNFYLENSGVLMGTSNFCVKNSCFYVITFDGCSIV